MLCGLFTLTRNESEIFHGIGFPTDTTSHPHPAVTIAEEFTVFTLTGFTSQRVANKYYWADWPGFFLTVFLTVGFC